MSKLNSSKNELEAKSWEIITSGNFLKEKDGFHYLPWFDAWEITVQLLESIGHYVSFDYKPNQIGEFGAIVGVELYVDGSKFQSIEEAVIDSNRKSRKLVDYTYTKEYTVQGVTKTKEVTVEALTSRDIVNAQKRALCKLLATAIGVGGRLSRSDYIHPKNKGKFSTKTENKTYSKESVQSKSLMTIKPSPISIGNVEVPVTKTASDIQILSISECAERISNINTIEELREFGSKFIRYLSKEDQAVVRKKHYQPRQYNIYLALGDSVSAEKTLASMNKSKA
jgi:hypothetical protein